MDCYFRQSWVDKRLSFEGYKVYVSWKEMRITEKKCFFAFQDALALSIEMLRKIWKPDTYGTKGFPSLFVASLSLDLKSCF